MLSTSLGAPCPHCEWLQGSSEAYLAPSLKLAQEHLQPLLEEAADVQQRLAALGW